ncbi:DoxX family membrane protein [Niabella yanshanensis]|uniref:DoxX family membrane protein n=1 Tax=Niabella yanshanensis TaxID=577386 RepID=A0ABZ0WA14_9BACT|nr:DoxX family membrane protein [Niabella yanshanensis]WQD38921.1 DoxX family membrane protein [Niabella yanshanensis]
MAAKSVSVPTLFLRIALSITMLSAVADRFGLWGINAAWGNWDNFEKYTAQLTFFLPLMLSKYAAYAATFLEIALPVLLILGYCLKIAANLTGVLLFIFALSMSISLGVKAPLDYSVWVGSAAAFLLAAQSNPAKQEAFISGTAEVPVEKPGNVIREAEHTAGH